MVIISRWRRTEHRHPANVDRHEHGTLGAKAADLTTNFMGSWRFIILQTVLIVMWMVLNTIALLDHWDPAPFILLNLIFSIQAAYASPLILLSQNRQAEHDRLSAEHDYQTNTVALQHLIALHEHQHGPDCRCPYEERIVARAEKLQDEIAAAVLEAATSDPTEEPDKEGTEPADEKA